MDFHHYALIQYLDSVLFQLLYMILFDIWIRMEVEIEFGCVLIYVYILLCSGCVFNTTCLNNAI